VYVGGGKKKKKWGISYGNLEIERNRMVEWEKMVFWEL
jgi:hypothetical protein